MAGLKQYLVSLGFDEDIALSIVENQEQKDGVRDKPKRKRNRRKTKYKERRENWK